MESTLLRPATAHLQSVLELGSHIRELEEKIKKLERTNETLLLDSRDKELIDVTAIKVLTRAIDEFISECIDESGNIKAPSRKAVMKYRGILPKSFKNTLQKDK